MCRADKLQRAIDNYPSVLAEYEAGLAAERAERERIAAEEQARVFELQDHFGYAVDVDDPRFQALLEQKELERKKELRKKEKEEKEARMLATMT